MIKSILYNIFNFIKPKNKHPSVQVGNKLYYYINDEGDREYIDVIKTVKNLESFDIYYVFSNKSYDTYMVVEQKLFLQRFQKNDQLSTSITEKP